MNELNLKYHPYSLNFKTPFRTSKSTITERKGLIVMLGDGVSVGAGEAAPLPEYGSETFESELEFLNDFKLNLKIDFSDFQASLEENLEPFNKMPALRHGFEQALLNFVSAKSKLSLNELLNRESARTVKVNAAIGFLPEDELNTRTQEIVKDGFGTIKLKVGRDNFADDISAVELVRNIAGPGIKIRIDANGMWNTGNAIKNLEQLGKFGIEYCEQPVNNIEEFLRIKSSVDVPLAADESVRSYENAVDIIKSRAADVLILKPMMLGGITRACAIMDIAEKNGVSVTITSSFESAVGRSFAVLASSFLKEDKAHGLATAEYFENEFVEDLYPVKNGQISLG